MKMTELEETNFNRVKAFLKAALTELKKGEHDQLTSALKRMSKVRQDSWFMATYEEAINLIIEGVDIIKERWEK
jgi:hypothetical protein